MYIKQLTDPSTILRRDIFLEQTVDKLDGCAGTRVRSRRARPGRVRAVVVDASVGIASERCYGSGPSPGGGEGRCEIVGVVVGGAGAVRAREGRGVVGGGGGGGDRAAGGEGSHSAPPDGGVASEVDVPEGHLKKNRKKCSYNKQTTSSMFVC